MADEANKDTVTAPELAGATSMPNEPPAQQPSDRITVPVSSVVGEDDALFCTGLTEYNCASTKSVQSFESPYYPAAPRLRVVVMPDTGHDLALSTTAPLTDAQARCGNGPGRAAPIPGRGRAPGELRAVPTRLPRPAGSPRPLNRRPFLRHIRVADADDLSPGTGSPNFSLRR